MSNSTSGLVKRFLVFLRDRVNLDDDQANEHEIVDSVRKGIEFRGSNLWVLIFSIFIASVGLNMNSTAVVIGAMLISPLMGPIMGVGLGIAIFDFDLTRKSIKNLSVFVLFSVVTSTLYFAISPISDAQSELLARTTPTAYDVLIALFGGLAGIVAASRKDKSTVVPGVAIATALMPPLCTAGYGLATGQWNFFFGAFYLFFINSVFIAFATYLVVQFLQFSKKEFVDAETERRVKRYTMIVVLITVLPSIWLAYDIVNKSIFERDAQQFLRSSFDFPRTQVLQRTLDYKRTNPEIEVLLIGDPLSDEEIEHLRSKLPDYGLAGAQLTVRQSGQDNIRREEIGQLRSVLLEDLYRRSEDEIRSKDEQIALLEREVVRLKREDIPVLDIAREAKALFPGIRQFTAYRALMPELAGDSLGRVDTVTVAFASLSSRLSANDRTRLIEWLKARTGSERLQLVTE